MGDAVGLLYCNDPADLIDVGRSPCPRTSLLALTHFVW
jgi:hypothetical protein